MRILESIVKIGLLLVPECISFDEYYEDGSNRRIKLGQKRLCLTDIDRSRLLEHAQAFGRFSIEWSHSTAIEMGAAPVFYFPEVVRGAPGLSNLSGTLICRLAETVSLLKTVEDLRNYASKSDPGKPLVVHQEETGENLCLDVGSTKRLLDHLNTRYRGLSALSANISGLAQLFVPTHNSSYTDRLAYYRQREWRLISDISAHGKPTWRALTNRERVHLLSVNPDFFGKEIETLTGRHRRVDECRVYVDPADTHPLSRASSIIVPSAVVSPTEYLLKTSGFDLEVLALESLG